MTQAKSILASAITGLSLVVVGFVATPSLGNAEATMGAAERVQAVFELVAETDGSKGRQAVRTVSDSYQADSTANLLIRKPGA